MRGEVADDSADSAHSSQEVLVSIQRDNCQRGKMLFSNKIWVVRIWERVVVIKLVVRHSTPKILYLMHANIGLMYDHGSHVLLAFGNVHL
eukprot:954375-Amphidinium_carterae.1